MSITRDSEAGRVLRGQALANAIRNFSTVRQLVASGQQIKVCANGDENNPFNENSDHPDEVGWSNASLPDELGRLNPPEDWRKEGKVPDPVINGVTQRDSKGQPIRDFRFLPRYLSSDLPGKKIEAYFHKDSRVRYDDLWARMPSCTPPLTRAIKNHRYNNKRIREVRAPYHVPCFTTRRTTITRTDVEIAATLTREMVRQGTVWPVTPHGIQDPSNPTRFLPLNSFLEPSTQFDIGSKKTWKSIYLLSVLNVVAKVRDAPGDYSTLARKHLPKSWSDRLSGSRAAVQEEDTDSDDDDNQENSDHDTTGQERSAPETSATIISTELEHTTSTEEETSSDKQVDKSHCPSPRWRTGVTLTPGEYQSGNLGSRNVPNHDTPIDSSNRTRFHHQDTNSYHNPNTGSTELSSRGLLSSELFEQVARLRQDRNSQIRRPRFGLAAPRNMYRRAPGVIIQTKGAQTNDDARYASGSFRQIDHSWAYGDYTNRGPSMQHTQGRVNLHASNSSALQPRGIARQTQQHLEQVVLQPPSHGLLGLHDCDENIDFSRYAPVDPEEFDDSDPFRIY